MSDIILPRLDPRVFSSARSTGREWHQWDEHQRAIQASGILWSNAPHPVHYRSPVSVRRSLETLATYFRREFGYDFVQYAANEAASNIECRRDVSFLWCDRETESEPLAFGGCSFRWRAYRDAPAGWALAWVWFHPYWRGRGHLHRAWPYFEARFGRFMVEHPWSNAMRAFLLRRQHFMLMEPWPRSVDADSKL